MLERYKKDFGGEKKLAELIETVATSKQKQIVKVGYKEDSRFMKKALQYVIEWDDIIKMDRLHLSELMFRAKTKANAIAIAITNLSTEKQKDFLTCCEREIMGKVKDALEYKQNITKVMVFTAQTELIIFYRQLITEGILVQLPKDPDLMLKKLSDEQD